MVKAAKNPATERGRRLVEYLSEVLTSESCPITADDWRHFSFVVGVYGTRDLIDKFATRFDEWPQMKEEILVAMLVEALNRLIE